MSTPTKTTKATKATKAETKPTKAETKPEKETSDSDSDSDMSDLPEEYKIENYGTETEIYIHKLFKRMMRTTKFLGAYKDDFHPSFDLGRSDPAFKVYTTYVKKSGMITTLKLACHRCSEDCRALYKLAKLKTRPVASRDDFVIHYDKKLDRTYVPYKGLVKISNPCGVNPDYRGQDHCVAELECNAGETLELESPTVEQLIRAFYSMKSHHFDNNYEMYCGAKVVEYKSPNYVHITLNFDHGS